MKFNYHLFIIIFITISVLVLPTSIKGKAQEETEGEDTQKAIEILLQPHPFYDAQILANIFIEQKMENKPKIVLPQEKILTVLKVLAKYPGADALKKKITEITSLTPGLANDLLPLVEKFNNPFLKQYTKALHASLKDVCNLDDKSQISQDKTTIESEDIAPAKKGLISPTVFVEALSTLIADRFKEELEIAFLKRFKEELDKESGSGLGLLFPTSAAFLTSTEIFNFKIFLPTLNEAFKKDLKNFDGNLSDYLQTKLKPIEETKKETNSPPAPQTEPNNPSQESQPEKIMILSICCLDLFHSIRTGENPTQSINGISEAQYLQMKMDNVSSSLKLLSLVSRNLTNNKGDGWLKSEDLKILAQSDSKDLKKLFLGLIYLREETLINEIRLNKQTLTKIIKANTDKIQTILEYFNTITLLTEKIECEVSKLQDNNEIGIEEYNTYLELIYDLVELALDINRFTGGEAGNQNILQYLNYAKNIMGIIKNINQGEYSLALANALTVLQNMFDKIPAGFIKYTTFVINMANAKDAEEMHKILAAAAMPVGSYRIVRSSPLTVTLSAYPGFFGGREELNTDKHILGKRVEYALGFASPVGIAVSHGRGDFEKPGPSYSLFFSVIDIGPTVSWRLKGKDQGLPELAWKNIIAPGAFFFIGIKNYPVSFGCGIQYGPQLREIKGPEEAVIESSAFRWGFIVAVDIPLFNIYSKGR